MLAYRAVYELLPLLVGLALPLVFEAQLHSKTGAAYPYYFTGKLIAFNGQPCVIGMGLDITQRKDAELGLQASQRRFTELVNEIEGIVWEADAATFDFTFVSNFAQTLLGYPVSQWYEHGFWREHVHPDDRAGRRDQPTRRD